MFKKRALLHRINLFVLVLIGIIPTLCLAGQWEHKVIRLSDSTRTIEPEVTFLAEAPRIDGTLDETLSSLPERFFTTLIKVNRENPLVPVHYRLAYGTHFFYVYIEAKSDSLFYRDRAYQNGDGFNLVLALPRHNNEPTDEFNVLACSAVKEKRLEWSRHIFWYYNVNHIFRSTSGATKLEFRKQEGGITFELLLPWKDVYPYHPWITNSLGFNLRFVKGTVNGSKNLYYTLYDNRLDSENSLRRYRRLTFQEPALDTSSQTYLILNRNHIRENDSLAIQSVTLTSQPFTENLHLVIRTGEGTPAGSHRLQYECEAGLTRNKTVLPTHTYPSGGYRVKWNSGENCSGGELELSILPKIDSTALTDRIELIGDHLSQSSYRTLQFLWQEIQDDLKALKEYETAGAVRIRLKRLLELIRQAEQGTDVLSRKTGFVRKAYRSRLDSTLQPYVIRIPPDFDPEKKYPLLVYLHGSASTEKNLMDAGIRSLLPERFIALAPGGRGPSNLYSWDHAQTDIAEAIETVIRDYPVNKNRIFLTGFSMGGYGVYRTYYETPQKFKALAVFSGHPNLANRWTGTRNYPNFLKNDYLKSFKNIPIFIFHGKRDLNTPYELTRHLVAKLKKAGALVNFHVGEDKGHETPGEDTIRAFHRWIREIAGDSKKGN